jgi:hypothetical protein
LIGGLSVISERPGQGAVETSTLGSPSVEMTEEKESAWKALPLLMISQVSCRLTAEIHDLIMQYGLLALHNTTHDQVFLSFLVTYVAHPMAVEGADRNADHTSLADSA